MSEAEVLDVEKAMRSMPAEPLAMTADIVQRALGDIGAENARMREVVKAACYFATGECVREHDDANPCTHRQRLRRALAAIDEKGEG